MNLRCIALLVLVLLTGLPATPAAQAQQDFVILVRAIPDFEKEQLRIEGRNFGNLPQVFIGKNDEPALRQLLVVDSSPTHIDTLYTPEPGTYLLAVVTGVVGPRLASLHFTIGAEGPAGSPGPAGPAGPRGRAGEDGPPGRLEITILEDSGC